MCRVEWADDELEWLGEALLKAPGEEPVPTCGDCGRQLQRGERYNTAAWYDHNSERTITATMCARCQAAARWLDYACGGWIYGEVLDELAEHWTDHPAYRTVGLARLIVCGRRRWQRAGQLVPVETVTGWVDAAITRTPEALAAWYQQGATGPAEQLPLAGREKGSEA